MVYSSDCDYVEMPAQRFAAFTECSADADLVIFDAQYTIEERVGPKCQWGHSSFSVGSIWRG